MSTFTSIACGDLDGDARPEILAYSGLNDRKILAFGYDGAFKWQSDVTEGVNWGAIAIADLDADGSPEIILGRQVLDNTGKLLWTGERLKGLEISIASDLDLDGRLEVLDGYSVYRADGTPAWTNQPLGRARSAVGNFDGDPFGEVVAATTARIELYEHDGTRRWSYAGSQESMGAPTVGDFDGDGQPEVGVARRSAYVVVDTDGSLLWQRPIQDNSSAVTGSSVFDFDGDGVAEVIYRDEVYLRVFRGTDGRVLLRIRFHSATANESPLVADIDNDGHAEIVVPGDHTALLPANPPPGVKSGIYVYTGVNDDWVRTRPIWNQHSYHVTNVNLDGTVPRNERANWLVPGLNHFRLNDFLPEEEGGADRFTYRATDGNLQSSEATVYLELRPPNSPPEIVSEPATSATVGFEYLAFVRAIDADRDSLTFSLVESPAGTTIDVNGIIRWTPGATGDFPVSVRVEDDDGAAGFQRFTIHVVEPVTVPDVRGLGQVQAEAALAAAGLEKGRVSAANHPATAAGLIALQDPPPGAVAEPGAAVDLVVSIGPAPGDVDDDGDTFSESEGDCDDANGSVFPGAPEPPGDGIDQDCDGDDASLPIVEIILEPGELTLVEGESADLAASGVAADGTSRILDAVAAWQSNGAAATVDSTGKVSAESAGAVTIKASHGGVMGTATVTVVAAIPADQAPPAAAITSPADAETVLGPIDVIGTAEDMHLVRYELAIAPAGESGFTAIGGGTTSVVVGILGRLDPTLLLNDLYDLRLTVFDAGGNQRTASVVVGIDGNQKVGPFSITFTDLVIPVAGVPISVRRTYDSRDKTRGDFGVGWRIDLQSFRVRTSRVLGTGWFVQKSGLAYRLVPTAEHRAIVQGPGGTLEQFDLVLRPSASAIVPLQTVQASFEPRSGSDGTLEVIGNSSLVLFDPQPGEAQLYDDETFDVYDPQLFRFTARSGLSLVISRKTGLQSTRDSNGNTLTFGPDGVTHSTGASIAFGRDADGRIRTITDPNGNLQTYTYDANGDLRSHADAEGVVTRFSYNRRHDLLRIDAPQGRFIRNEYDDGGRLVASSDAAGNRLEVYHDLGGQTELETDRRGNSQILRYDGRGNVLARERTVTIDGVPVVARDTYQYDSIDNLTAVVNADGIRTQYAYTGIDLAESVLDPGGLNISQGFAYDQRGNTIERTDPLGGTTRFTYDSRGNPTSYTDPAGSTTSLAYDAAGRLIRRQDSEGNWTSFAHDALGRAALIETFDAQGFLLGRRDFTYDRNGNVLTEIALRDVDSVLTPLVTRYTYDSNNQRLTTQDPLGNVTWFEYEPDGQLRSATDARGKTTRYSYGPTGLLVRTEFPDGAFEESEFDADGNRIKATDAAGRETRFEYDELNRLTATILPDSAAYRSIYTPGGLLAASIDWNGRRKDYTYDAAGRRASRLEAETVDGSTGTRARPETREEHDAAGRLRAVIDPTGRRTELTYDAAGRLTEVVYADGSSSTRAYDILGRLVSTENEDGQSVTYVHDGLGRLSEVTLHAPAPGTPAPITTFAYDQAGNLIAQIDALGRATAFKYDALNRLVRRTLPGGQAETFAYDQAGNLSARTDFAGRTTVFEHDERNRLTARRFPDGFSHTFEYIPTGSRAAATDSRGRTTYEYDMNERLASIMDPENHRIDYTYDAAGSVTSIATAAQVVSYEYDELGRLARVSSPAGLHEYSFDLAGRVLRVAAPNGVVTTVERDARGRVECVTHASAARGVLASFRYMLSPGGLRLRQEEADGSVETYGYDGLGRLIREVRTGHLPRMVDYEYDAVGNRVRRLRNGVETLYEFDANDRIVASTGASYSYDANGNRSARVQAGGTTTYVWDALDRLVEASTPAGVTRFTYDVDGHRVRSQGQAGVRNHLVDTLNPTGLAQTIEERDGIGGVVAAYTYGGSLLAMETPGGPLFHEQDAHGSTRLLTNAAGDPVAAYAYDGYGTDVESTGTATPYRYAGERLEDGLDLYYLRARHYDPDVGLFLGMDPLPGKPEDPLSLHRYLYARANPVSFVDPTGLTSTAELSITQGIQNGMKRAEIVGKVAKVCKLTAQLQALVIAGTQAPDKKFSIEFSPRGVTTSAGLSPELAVFTVCGQTVAKVELKLRFGTSVTGKGFLARASVGIEVKSFNDALKQTFPWFAIEFGNTNGFGSSAAFNVRLADLTPQELGELFKSP